MSTHAPKNTNLTHAHTKPEWAMSRREIEAELRKRAGLPPLRSRWRWAWLAVPVILLIVSLVYFGTTDSVSEDRTPADFPPVMQISTEERFIVNQNEAVKFVSVSGTANPVQRAVLSAEVSGNIESVAVSIGDPVDLGQLLVQIRTATLIFELNAAKNTAASARAQVELAESEANRARTLSGRGVTSAASVEQSEGSLANLRAALAAQEEQVRAAELRLMDASVKSPFKGVVSERSVDPGEYVNVGTALVSVVDPSLMRLEAKVPVASAEDIRPDQIVRVVSPTGQEMTGQVRSVSPVTSEGSRSLRVFVDIPNPEGKLLGGMFLTGSVITSEKSNALLIPDTAVMSDDAGPYVLRISNKVLERVNVTIGQTWEGDEVEVSQGLQPGDTILSTELSGLAAGTPVTLSER